MKFINSLKWDFDACGAADSAGRSAAEEYRGHYIVLFYKDPQHEKRIHFHFHFTKNRLERAHPASTLAIGTTSTLQKRRGCCLYIYKISSVIDSSKGICSRTIIMWRYLLLTMTGLFVCFDNSA